MDQLIATFLMQSDFNKSPHAMGICALVFAIVGPVAVVQGLNNVRTKSATSRKPGFVALHGSPHIQGGGAVFIGFVKIIGGSIMTVVGIVLALVYLSRVL